MVTAFHHTLFFEFLTNQKSQAGLDGPLMRRFLICIYTCRIIESMTFKHSVHVIDNISNDIFTFVSGIPVTSGAHAADMANCMIELVQRVGQIQIPEYPNVQISLRVGIHTGLGLSIIFFGFWNLIIQLYMSQWLCPVHLLETIKLEQNSSFLVFLVL